MAGLYKKPEIFLLTYSFPMALDVLNLAKLGDGLNESPTVMVGKTTAKTG